MFLHGTCVFSACHRNVSKKWIYSQNQKLTNPTNNFIPFQLCSICLTMFVKVHILAFKSRDKELSLLSRKVTFLGFEASWKENFFFPFDQLGKLSHYYFEPKFTTFSSNKNAKNNLLKFSFGGPFLDISPPLLEK